MKKIVIIIVLIINSCSTINISRNNFLLGNDEIEIYELLINTFLDERKGSFVAIKEETMILPLDHYSKDKDFFLANFGNDYNHLFDKYWKNNRNKYRINFFIDLHENYIAYNELLKIMKKYIKENNLKGMDTFFWKVFKKIDPNICGIITLSKIVFDNEKNEALLQIEYLFGSLGLEGYYVLLEKTERWEIVERLLYIIG